MLNPGKSFMVRTVFFVLLLLLSSSGYADSQGYLFDDPKEESNWSNIDTGLKDPPVKIEYSNENTTKSKYSLKLTFGGGEFPTVGTKVLPGDILNTKYLCADVTVPRDCVLGFSLFQEKSQEGYSVKVAQTKFIATVFLHKGLNKAGVLLSHRFNSFTIKNGDVLRFDIFLYHPQKGESIFIDNIRFSSRVPPIAELPWHDREWQSEKNATKADFKILNSDKSIKAYRMYTVAATAPKDNFAYFGDKDVAGIQNDMKDKLAELRKQAPDTELAVFRRGDKGFNPASPGKIYENAADAYVNTHGPDGNLIGGRANYYGSGETSELFMDHRSTMYYFDLSSIPAGSKIIDARFVVTRTKEGKGGGVFVAIPCNRRWDEKTVNAFEYAYGKCWKELFAFSFTGEDPDFQPLILAGGFSGSKTVAGDFTEAVKFWTDGKNANNGFHFPSDGADYLSGFNSKNKTVSNRPALFVIYEPKK
ncbi:MAG: DNRLRE domain-containing protein [Candidatus Firestonebacteria bacterium]